MDRKSNFSPFQKWLRARDSREISGAPGQTRTGDPLLRRQTLYPTELRARGYLDSKTFEPCPDSVLSQILGSTKEPPECLRIRICCAQFFGEGWFGTPR